VEVVRAGIDDAAVLRRLLELYQHDFSEFDGRELNAHGEYGYRYLDYYWTEPERHALLFSADGHLAGFALAPSPPH
jgi:predicted acetyltransferase